MQYLADTPDGAWAEFLRHEEITDPDDLAGVDRNLWAVAVDEGGERIAEPALELDVLTGDENSYPGCQAAAGAYRQDGATALLAPSAALVSGAARGQSVGDGALVESPARDGRVLVLFGPRSFLSGWLCADGGRPSPRLLPLVRHFAGR